MKVLETGTGLYESLKKLYDIVEKKDEYEEYGAVL